MNNRPNQVKRASKTSSTGLRRIIQGKTAVQGKARNASFRSRGSTTSQWPPRVVVAKFPLVASIYRTFHFPTQFFDFCCCFVFKKRMNMAGKASRFHKLALIKSLKLHWRDEKEKED